MRKVSAKVSRPRDSIIWITEDDVGESFRQTLILALLHPAVVRWLAARNVTAFVGSDQYIYWDANNPRKSLAPDLYVMAGVSPLAVPTSWCLWNDAVMPVFALEVVGDNVEKDYRDGPKLYDEMGVEELIVFDPLAQEERGSRIPWQVFRRVKNRGLVRVLATAGDRVESSCLRCWLRSVETAQGTVVRLATGKHGDDLVPTAEEDALARVATAEEDALARVATVEEDARVRVATAEEVASALHQRAAAAEERAAAAEEEVKRLKAGLPRGKGRPR